MENSNLTEDQLSEIYVNLMPDESRDRSGAGTPVRAGRD